MVGTYPRLRRSRSLVTGFLVLVAMLAVVDSSTTPVVADAATLIDFEENIPTAGNITKQYCISAANNKGVEFLDPVRRFEPAIGTMTPTHAATNHFIGDEFTEPNIVRISFTADQAFISLRVGLDRDYDFPVTAYVRGYTTSVPAASSQLANGEDHVLLGSTATPINQQLYLAGGGAQSIRSIEIEFASATSPSSAFEVFDNLLYPTLGPQCGNDTIDPIVQIFEPVPGAPFYGAPSGGDVPLTLHFRATDNGSGVAMVNVEFLDSGNTVLDSFSVCGGTSVPSCALPSLTVERNFLSLMPAGTATLRVAAEDFAGNEGDANRSVTVTTSSANLWARGLEITQAIQPWVATNTAKRRDLSMNPPTSTYPLVPESVPLVAGRTTVARLFVGVEGTIGGAELSRVGATLRCFSEASYTLSCPGPSEIHPEHQPPKTTKTVAVDPGHSLLDQRRQSIRTLNFVLPDDWTKVGTIHLEATVTPPIPECDACTDAANSIRVRYVTFREVPNWHSVVRQVLVDRLSYGTATDAERRASLDFIRRIYPVDESTVMNGFRIMPYLWLSFPGLGGPDCSEFLSDLDSTYDYLLEDYGYMSVWALTDSQSPQWCSGLGRPSGVAVSRGDRWDSGAHEIGHTLDLLHAGPAGQGHGAECDNNHCDSDWPWPHGGIGDFGFDVIRFEVHDPGNPPADAHDHDVMSYGSPLWISPRNWIRLFNALAGWSFPYPKAAAASAAQAVEADVIVPTPHLLVRGHYDSDTSKWQLLPLYEVDRLPQAPEVEDPDLLVELVDASGTVLVTQRIDLLDTDHVDTDDPNVLEIPDPSFVRFIEMPAGTDRVNLRAGQTLLASRTRSDQTPTVSVVTPTAAGFGGSIRWDWNDGDSDPMVALVEYRYRSDVPWQPLTIDVEDDVLTIDPALLPGGSAVQVRVTVTDGFNTASALSDLFTVADSRPAAEILRPASGDLFESARRIVMRGNASDPEDEVLSGDALAWSSNVDGALGTGGFLEVPGLSAGIHLITLTATDSIGNTDANSVVVLVAAPPDLEHQPIADAGPDQGWTGTGVTVLDATGSFDPDGDPLTYRWSIALAPAGAWAFFDDPAAAQPTLYMGSSGTYEIDLIVHDGAVGSRPDRVVVNQDLAAPIVQVEFPLSGLAVQDGVDLAATALDDASGVDRVWFALREDDGADGVPIGYERLDAGFDPATGIWIHPFDTVQVPDGHYLVLAWAEDAAGNGAVSEAVAFSVRNWAILEMLPATPNHNAGRTVPVRFSINVVAAADPATPFVHNEELVVLIYETSRPDILQQEATFGPGSRDYRIDDEGEKYITNFKTLRRSTEYTVEIRRDDFEIGSFTFTTVRAKGKEG